VDNQIKILKKKELPQALLEIPQPPTKLYIIGELPKEENLVFLCVVGSRKYTSYGRDIAEKLIEGLAGYPVVIVSGLALGIDSIAHQKAIDVGLKTIAFPGSGLKEKVIYPKSNFGLAQRIIEKGGCLLSEFEPDFEATQWSFPCRNRLMTGISRAILVIEAEQKSGTLITARMATDYNRDVLAVPGSVFSPNSVGTNRLIRQGATPITNSNELLEALGFNVTQKLFEEKNLDNCSPEEKEILEILREPISRDDITRRLGKSTSEVNTLLSIMEIKGLIKEEMGEIRMI